MEGVEELDTDMVEQHKAFEPWVEHILPSRVLVPLLSGIERNTDQTLLDKHIERLQGRARLIKRRYCKGWIIL